MRIFNDDQQRTLVVHVVLLNRTVSSCCRERRQHGLPADPHKVMRELVGALDHLVEFLDSEVHEAIDHDAAA